MILRRGFSIVELIIVIAILGLLIAAVTTLAGRSFTISRSQFEQTRTTEEARVHMERMTDTIRNARPLVCSTAATPSPTPAPKPTALDVVFVIDTTWSMRDDLDAMKASSAHIIDTIRASVSDARIGIVTYRDYPTHPYGEDTDYPVEVNLPFFTDRNGQLNTLNAVNVGGGGDDPESIYCGLATALGPPLVAAPTSASDAAQCPFATKHTKLGAWRADALKAIILIGDAPAHDPEPFTDFRLADIVRQRSHPDAVRIFSIGVTGHDPTHALPFLENLAKQNGGAYFFSPKAQDVVAAILDAVEVASQPAAATATQGNNWLQEASADRMVFYSNVDADAATEKITYEKVGNELHRIVEQDTPTVCSFAAGSAQVVARSIYNTPAQPLFTYIAADGTTLTPPVPLANVVRVKIQLVVDSEGSNLDDAATIATDITPRLGQQLAAAPVSTPTPTLPAPTPNPSATPTAVPSPTPVPSSSVIPRDCLLTGQTINNKKILLGDGGCAYVNPAGGSLVWRRPLPPATGWPTASNFTWSFANTQCENMTEGGRSDWRLATTTEYRTLSIPENAFSSMSGIIGVVYRGLPMVDMYLGGPGVPDRPYWTATVNPGDSSMAEFIMIRSGKSLPQAKTPGPAVFPENFLCVAPLRVPESSLTPFQDQCSTIPNPTLRKWCNEDEPERYATYG